MARSEVCRIEIEHRLILSDSEARMLNLIAKFPGMYSTLRTVIGGKTTDAEWIMFLKSIETGTAQSLGLANSMMVNVKPIEEAPSV